MGGYHSADRLVADFEIRYNGYVTMRQYELADLSCYINTTYYPADTQECANSYGTYPPNSQGGIRYNNITFGLHPYFGENAEFSIISLEVILDGVVSPFLYLKLDIAISIAQP